MELARAWRKNLPLRAVFFGCLLPDLIDKPLYYIPHWLTGKHGAELGLLSGTRTIGHSLLFLLLLLAAGAFPGKAGQRKLLRGVALGAATHLALDTLPELASGIDEHSSLIALLFPSLGWRFPLAYYRTASEHFLSHLGWYDLAGESLGLFLLLKLKMRPLAAADEPG
jgi:membrane-bound metal-dependent hydrolase YbcI (DUF457 family)